MLKFKLVQYARVNALAFIVISFVIFACNFESTNDLKPLTDDEFNKIVESKDSVEFQEIGILTDSQAEVLSKYDGLILNLSGLQKLSVKQASFISRYKSKLRAQHGFSSGRLHLDGLNNIDEETSAALSNFSGWVLSLDGLTSLTENEARHIGKCRLAELHLNGLIEVSDQTMAYLTANKLWVISLNGLIGLTERQCELLTSKITIKLSGLTTISDKEFETLMNSFRRLELNGLKSLSDFQVTTLLEFSGGVISLDGVKQVNTDWLKTWTVAEFTIELGGLYSISEEQAELLGQFESSMLILENLRALTDYQMEMLTKFKGHLLNLNGLHSITDNQARSIGDFGGDMLYLNGLKSLSETQAISIASFTVDSIKNRHRLLHLEGLERLTPAVARGLSSGESQRFHLYLDGIEELDSLTALELGSIKGNTLSLNGITTMDTIVAKGLANFEGKFLNLYGLRSISNRSHGILKYGIARVVRFDPSILIIEK